MSEFWVHVASVNVQQVFLSWFGSSVAFLNCSCGDRRKVFGIGWRLLETSNINSLNGNSISGVC